MTDIEQNIKKEKSLEKDQAIESIENAIQTIEKDNRKLARWETSCIVHGIQAVHSGLYRLASVEGELALTPVNERINDNRISDEFDQYGLPLLKEALEVVKAAPIMLHPHFLGPKK